MQYEGVNLLLLTKEADVSWQNHTGMTPLHMAASQVSESQYREENHANTITVLLQHKADPTIEDNRRKTPLAMATNPKVRQLLEEAMKPANAT